MRISKRLIKGIETCLNKEARCEQCPYNREGRFRCRQVIMSEALKVMKSIQPKPVVKRENSKYYWYECPGCHDHIKSMPGYCPHCGQELIWTAEQEE